MKRVLPLNKDLLDKVLKYVGIDCHVKRLMKHYFMNFQMDINMNAAIPELTSDMVLVFYFG